MTTANRGVETVVDDVKFSDGVKRNAVGNFEIFENVDENAVKDVVENADRNAAKNLKIFELVDKNAGSLEISENAETNVDGLEISERVDGNE